ncbi:MAG: ROK family protein [Clostridia bacterium]|nr:ROK family protein [Clostridia bacterium]
MEKTKYYIGIDLGGTFVKGGIVDENGNLIVSDKVPTEAKSGNDKVVSNIAGLCMLLLEKAKITKEQVQGIGMGVPGLIDSQNGIVKYSNNLHFEHFDIAGALQAKTGLPVKIANDANVAALGETKFGCGKEYDNTVLLTLGTGVGGGVVIGGKLFEGNGSAGAELGHNVIAAGGEPCGCGRKGCLEAYASATALIRDTKRAMEANRDSAMWEIGSIDNVTGKTAFDYMEKDKAAKSVVDNYIEKLGVGIVNHANTFRPQAVILGGGVCAEGDRLVKPLQEMLNEEIYAGARGPQVKLLTATLKNDAGIFGAVALIAGI